MRIAVCDNAFEQHLTSELSYIKQWRFTKIKTLEKAGILGLSKYVQKWTKVDFGKFEMHATI